jgi:hypothetical protein
MTQNDGHVVAAPSPIFKESRVSDDNKSIIQAFRILAQDCEDLGIRPPSYSSFWRRATALGTKIGKQVMLPADIQRRLREDFKIPASR